MSEHDPECRGCAAARAINFPDPDDNTPPRLWMEPGDVAELVWEDGEVIRGLWTKPRGTHAGWVLTDGSRISARPRRLVIIRVVYPPRHIATEEVTHDEPAHTTDADPEHDRG